jgi:uncharacterized membrane protein required for colicin V production
MSAALPWADIIVVAVIALAVFKGFTRGFVKEVGGLLALAALFIAPWFYNGAADLYIARVTGLGAPFAHAIGAFLTGVVAYIVIIIATWILGRIVKLSILGTGNAIAGAILGFVKSVVLIWLVLFIALFFPLTPQIRASLHDSHVARLFTTYDDQAGEAVLTMVPGFAKPYLMPYFRLHDV